MNPLLKRLYDLTPVALQNLLLTIFSARLDRKRYGGRFPEFRALMEEAQWWDARRMAEWQDARLRDVVAHAYAQVPYYRELFDQRGLRPTDIQCRGAHLLVGGGDHGREAMIEALVNPCQAEME